MHHILIGHDKLPGPARLVRQPLVEAYHNIEAAKEHTDKPTQVALVDTLEVARPLDVVEVVPLALVAVGIQVKPFVVVQGRNTPEGIVRMGDVLINEGCRWSLIFGNLIQRRRLKVLRSGCVLYHRGRGRLIIGLLRISIVLNILGDDTFFDDLSFF